MLRKHFAGENENVSDDKNAKGDDQHVPEAEDKSITAVSIELLYDGMVVQNDIFDATGSKLLVRKGNELGVLQIENIKRLNNGKDTIYVTNRTKSAMLAKRPNIDIDSRGQIEEATGYTEAKDETLNILEEIANNKNINQESLKEVSQELSEQLKVTSPEVILSIINALAPVDEYLQRHSTNVALLNGLIGRWMGLTNDLVDTLVLVGLLHDCGKALIPPKVLNATRALSLVEYEVVKMHAVYTYELLSDFPETIKVAAGGHHERLDGKGYPNGIMGDKIAMEARITAISDIYDAMVSQRSYKPPRSPFRIMAYLKKLSGNEIDPDIASIFIKNMPKGLMNKPVMMSDGTIGILRDYDEADIEYPMVETGGNVRKTDKDFYCVSMFTDD